MKTRLPDMVSKNILCFLVVAFLGRWLSLAVASEAASPPTTHAVYNAGDYYGYGRLNAYAALNSIALDTSAPTIVAAVTANFRAIDVQFSKPMGLYANFDIMAFTGAKYIGGILDIPNCAPYSNGDIGLVLVPQPSPNNGYYNASLCGAEICLP